jgi:hypothetical protein
MIRLVVFLIVLVVALPSFVSAQKSADQLVYDLESFGPIGNQTEAQSTWAVARKAMREKPGVILVPGRVWSMLKPDSLQSLVRIPEAPVPARTWKHGAGPAAFGYWDFA